MRSTKSFTLFLLAFFLLFTQVAAVAHGIGHVMSEQQQDQGVVPDSMCDLCAAYAQMGSAIPSSQVDLLQSVSPDTVPHVYRLDSFSYPTFGFSARAPPVV